MGELRRVSTVLVLASAIAVTLVGLSFSSPPARAATYVLWSDGFESGLTNWQVSDENPNSGLDYWGVTAYKMSTGGSSVWCAQVGTSSVNGLPNSQNHYYDQDMDANLIRDYGDVSGYSSLTVTFSYWAVTGMLSLSDYLVVEEYTGGSWVQIWTQPSVSSGGWKTATASLSTASTSVDFIFHSDSTVGLGPYEGVYLDDVSVSGIDNAAPTSQATQLPAYQTSRDFSVPYTAADNTGGSGLASVALYYSTSSTGPWTSAGSFTSSPVSFSASGEGAYYFYTLATDRAGNTESAPATPDTSTIVDTAAPDLTISSPGSGQTLSSSTVGLSWTALDSTSGIDRYEVRVDGGSWTAAGTANSYTFNALADGPHTADVRAFDRAGNVAIVTVPFTVNTNPFSPSGPGGGIALYTLLVILAVVIIVVALVWRSRRKRKTAQPLTPPQTPVQ